ncbi:hypothetical protein MCC10023_1503 [Bifidobacterium longum subsp. longum]|nr:hypothetical protein MCC10023_1503 [Bifidobacterium longum subsp. longum]
MLIPSEMRGGVKLDTSLSRRVNANSQLRHAHYPRNLKLIKKGEC